MTDVGDAIWDEYCAAKDRSAAELRAYKESICTLPRVDLLRSVHRHTLRCLIRIQHLVARSHQTTADREVEKSDDDARRCRSHANFESRWLMRCLAALERDLDFAIAIDEKIGMIDELKLVVAQDLKNYQVCGRFFITAHESVWHWSEKIIESIADTGGEGCEEIIRDWQGRVTVAGCDGLTTADLERELNKALRELRRGTDEKPKADASNGEPSEQAGDSTTPTKSKQSTERGEGSEQAARGLLSIYTNGLSDDRFEQAVSVLQNVELTLDKKLRKIDAAMPLPPNVSAAKLGKALGTSKAAVQKTSWYIENRKGERENEIGRRRENLRKRGTQHESDFVSDDEG